MKVKAYVPGTFSERSDRFFYTDDESYPEKVEILGHLVDVKPVSWDDIFKALSRMAELGIRPTNFCSVSNYNPSDLEMYKQLFKEKKRVLNFSSLDDLKKFNLFVHRYAEQRIAN